MKIAVDYFSIDGSVDYLINRCSEHEALNHGSECFNG